jgi:hypothetical protein
MLASIDVSGLRLKMPRLDQVAFIVEGELETTTVVFPTFGNFSKFSESETVGRVSVLFIYGLFIPCQFRWEKQMPYMLTALFTPNTNTGPLLVCALSFPGDCVPRKEQKDAREY